MGLVGCSGCGARARFWEVASTPPRRGSRAGSRRLGLCQLRVCDVGAGRDQSIASVRADQHQEQSGHGNRDEDAERDRADPGCSAELACSVPRQRSGGHDRTRVRGRTRVLVSWVELWWGGSAADGGGRSRALHRRRASRGRGRRRRRSLRRPSQSRSAACSIRTTGGRGALRGQGGRGHLRGRREVRPRHGGRGAGGGERQKDGGGGGDAVGAGHVDLPSLVCRSPGAIDAARTMPAAGRKAVDAGLEPVDEGRSGV